MGAFLNTIRSGGFLTRERMRLWALAVLAASAIGMIYLVVTSDGRITATHPNGGERIAAGFQRFASKRFLPSVGYAGAQRYMRNNRSDSP